MARARYGRWIIAGAILALILFFSLPGVGRSLVAWNVAMLEDCPEPLDHTKRPPFLVIGHRGSAGREIENTIPSVEAAVTRDSATAVEIDLSMTADRKIILWHDWDPDDAIAAVREKGTEPDVRYRPVFPEDESEHRQRISRLTLDQVRRHYGYAEIDAPEGSRVMATIPTLEEFARWAAGKERLRLVVLDLKIPEDEAHLAPEMLTLIERTLGAPSYRTIYLTPHERVLQAIERHRPIENISFDLEPPGGIVLEPCGINSARMAMKGGNRFASSVHPITSTVAPWTTLKRLVECDVRVRDSLATARSGQPIEAVIASTINDEEKIVCLMNLGIDGIITDFPDRARAVARRLGRKVE